ncbi:glycoside hydrolase family 18 [Fusarium mundagurra]|uniref:Glycoside hydrolase family 18 n=1 Tax=Fusarium mundagurra TaxID=1567541 RepID=A0A8H5Y097_9HYPO|nr:glycoside hydrolase family 18 [Fusarium mundagurra]
MTPRRRPAVMAATIYETFVVRPWVLRIHIHALGRDRAPIVLTHATKATCYSHQHYGGGHQCWSKNRKKYCCPANIGNRAIAACSWVTKDYCPTDLPQKIYTYSEGVQVGDSAAISSRTFCCPEKPKFEGYSGFDQQRPGNKKCASGRKTVMCCDPPTGDDAILPVPLEDLFPYIIPEDSTPVYYESIDNFDEAIPKNFNDQDNPNEQPFTWIIMVGDEKGVQSLRKRDGSHLELFDCPSPAQDDFQVQKLKAVCMSTGEGSNCEDLKLGGVHGTIARLPQHCGLDEWVRVRSFEAVDDHPYDYELHDRRADGGEVFVRIDGSTHPGYWDKIVVSKTGHGVARRSPKNWRRDEMAWFQEHGFAHKEDGNFRRGESGNTKWWLDQFTSLLKGHSE